MTAVLLTAIAMLAFAANSLLCREALGEGLIDASSFTSVRVLAGAAMLSLLLWPRWRRHGRPRPDWRTVLALFAYMICFSFAYLSLSAGTGALILFGAVQLTMFVVGLRAGESFSRASWLGLALAVGGLIYLVSPGVTAPDALGALLMALAGVAWGCYSLLGRRAGDPLAATGANFVYALPLALGGSLLSFGASSLSFGAFHVTPTGAALAVASGALASGLGYFAWYAALRHLLAIRAATVQLSVPVIAAVGGVLLLGEQPTARLLVASIATLGGIAIVLARRSR
jgi:drug/metabolite transporter (DMT)-like permease